MLHPMVALSGWYGEGCFSIIKPSSGLNCRYLILTQATPLWFCKANKEVNLDMLRAGFSNVWDLLIIPAISWLALVTLAQKDKQRIRTFFFRKGGSNGRFP